MSPRNEEQNELIKDERREQILSAALKVFARKGFAAAKISDIVARAGMSHGLVYHYFKSKEELGYAVLNRQFERFAERGLAILREPMIDPLERLVLFIDTLVALQVARGCKGGSPFGSLAAELADAHEGFRSRIAQKVCAVSIIDFKPAGPLLQVLGDTSHLPPALLAGDGT
jgi:AcrR family transcriptional regulator